VNGPLSSVRETENEPSARVREMVESASKTERVEVGD
jgi:hypothetical protein